MQNIVAKKHDINIDSTFGFSLFAMFCALPWQMLLGDWIPSLQRFVADAYFAFGIDFKVESEKCGSNSAPELQNVQS